MSGGPWAGMAGATPAAVAGAVAAVMLLAGLPWWVARAAARRRATRLATDGPSAGSAAPDLPVGERVDVPVVLELLGAALRAGAGVPRALEATGAALDGAMANGVAERGAVPVGSAPQGTARDAGPAGDGAALRAAASALRLGADWDGAWQHAPPRLAPVHRSLRGAWTDGASPTGALRAAGDELVRERRSAARAAAARLAVRLVLPLGACFLPAFVLVGLVPVLLALGIDLLSG